jgi:hypothetical protein
MGSVLASLIKEKGITMTYTFGAPKHLRYKNVQGFTVTLKYPNKAIRLPFYLGMGKPELELVINDMLLHGAAIDLTFPEYCKEFSYHIDRKSRRVYYYDRQIGKKLKNFLGEDDYRKFQENNDY